MQKNARVHERGVNECIISLTQTPGIWNNVPLIMPFCTCSDSTHLFIVSDNIYSKGIKITAQMTSSRHSNGIIFWAGKSHKFSSFTATVHFSLPIHLLHLFLLLPWTPGARGGPVVDGIDGNSSLKLLLCCKTKVAIHH